MGYEYTDTELVKYIDSFTPNFLMNYPIIAELCNGIRLTKSLENQLLYSSCTNGRPYRMLMYVLLLNETANLKHDFQLAYHLLREAYLMTDNIYGQLKQSTYPFVLADYLIELEKALPNRNSDELDGEEKNIYDELPQRSEYIGVCAMMKNNLANLV